MLRIAVLGCGRIGRMHADNIAARRRAALADDRRVFAEENFGTNPSGLGREGGSEGIEDHLYTKLASIVF